MLLTYEDITEV